MIWFSTSSTLHNNLVTNVIWKLPSKDIVTKTVRSINYKLYNLLWHIFCSNTLFTINFVEPNMDIVCNYIIINILWQYFKSAFFYSIVSGINELYLPLMSLKVIKTSKNYLKFVFACLDLYFVFAVTFPFFSFK